MRIRRCITSLGLVASLLSPFTLAHAQSVDQITIIAASPEEARQQSTIFAFLQEYFSTLAQGQVDKIATYHPTLTPQQLDILRNYFAHTIRDLHIRLEDVRVQVTASRAEIVFDRTDQFVDRDTSRPVQKSIRIKTALVQGAPGWQWQLSGPDQFAFILVTRLPANRTASWTPAKIQGKLGQEGKNVPLLRYCGKRTLPCEANWPSLE